VLHANCFRHGLYTHFSLHLSVACSKHETGKSSTRARAQQASVLTGMNFMLPGRLPNNTVCCHVIT